MKGYQMCLGSVHILPIKEADGALKMLMLGYKWLQSGNREVLKICEKVAIRNATQRFPNVREMFLICYEWSY